ncbi:hypothetical protein J5N97_002113 [Dioscorea zingiberensis]|uniref:FLZ-type domain-containing protein n=1 Tax=Dioscorea zingiberensis TaxID=325984 RepID=A0A9D5D3S7_9LILI|nr:hypothetical protein J5N97_002113 [Dioscorea zingiberensis]
MLPRTKSIFHFEEEEEEGGTGGVEAISREVHALRMRVSEGLVGLRILIQHPVMRGPCNILVKTNKFCADHNSGFLKSCFLCRRELSPNKDVYMYKGDQGFCSVECRYTQMVVDERREFEESARDQRLRMAPHSHANHHHQYHHPINSKIRDSDASRRRRRRRVLATAAA